MNTTTLSLDRKNYSLFLIVGVAMISFMYFFSTALIVYAAPPASPTFHASQSSSFNLGSTYTFRVNLVSGATNYGFQFFQAPCTNVGLQDTTCKQKYEYSPTGILTISPSHPFHSLIKAGTLKVRAWAYNGSDVSDPITNPERDITIIDPYAPPASPTFHASQSSSFNLGSTYTFRVNLVSGATNYGFQFFQAPCTNVGLQDTTCKQKYEYSPTGILTISPSHPFHSLIKAGTLKVRAWAYNGSDVSDPITNPERDITITAPAGRVLSVNKSGAGSGTVKSITPAGAPTGDIDCGTTCSKSYTTNPFVLLRATPAANSSFVRWNDCNFIQPNDDCSMYTDESKTVEAVFDLLPGPQVVNFQTNATSLPFVNTGATLSWGVSGTVNSCTASYSGSGGAGGWSSVNPKTATSYNTGVLPQGTHTYSIRCDGPVGTNPANASVSITVAAPLGVITSLSANQVLPIPYNTNVTLKWTSTNANTCTASGGAGTSWATNPNKLLNNTSGESVGPLIADTTFTLKCDGAGGMTNTAVFPVTVAPPPAVDITFNATPSSIASGNASTLSWSAPNAGPQAQPCIASGGWSGAKANTGTESTGSLTSDRTYTLECTGPGSTTSTSTKVIIVPTISVNIPMAGDKIEQGKQTIVSWTTTGTTGDDFEVIVLRNGAQATAGNPPVAQSFTTTTTTNPRTFVWDVPSTLAVGGGYAIRVEAISNRIVQDTSDVTFNIVPQPKIQVTSPNIGTESWNIGSIGSPSPAVRNITWTSIGLVGDKVKITLKRQPGNVTVGLLTPLPSGSAPNDQGNFISSKNNTFQWRLAEDWLSAGAGYTIEVCSISIPTLCDESNNSFTILDEIPRIAFTNLTISPASPYTIGESQVTYSATFANNGIRALSGLTLTAWVAQAGARSAVIELPLACRTQLPGIMASGNCLSDDGVAQKFLIDNETGQFVQGQGKFISEIKLGGSSLNPPVKQEIVVQLFPAPKVTVNNPNGPATVQKFAIGSPMSIKWKTVGLVERVNIKIKQEDPVNLYDFNNDGAVNEQDDQALIDLHLNGTAAECFASTGKNCDIDGDGDLTISDHLWLINNILLQDSLRYVDRADLFDFHGDGVFDIQDNHRLAQLMQTNSLQQCFAQTGKRCDVNRNGVYEVSDSVYLQNILKDPPPDASIPGGTFLLNNKDAENELKWTPNIPFVTPAGNYKILICDSARPQVCDESNQTFLIYASPPTITSPATTPDIEISESMSIRLMASHPMGLTDYKVSLYQNAQLIYDNIRDNNGLPSSMPFFIDNTLIRKTDGKRLIDLLRDGRLRFVVSAKLGSGGGFTNAAERIITVKFNRTPPLINKPTDNQEVNLGSGKIEIVATHKSNPASYKVSLWQNNTLIYLNESVPGSQLGMQLILDPTTRYGEKNVFQSLTKGSVLLVVQGKLLDGYTDEANRTFTVIPLPPDYDLNDDGFVTRADLAILQATIVYDSALRRAIDEGKATTTVRASSLIEPCINANRVKPKNCNYYVDFETTSNKRSRGMRIIDSRDAAILVSSAAYNADAVSAPATISSTGAPTVAAPNAGAHWIAGAPQNIVIESVAGARGYLVGFIRGSTMIYENYRDNGGMNGICNIADTQICVGAGTTQTYTVPSTFASKFTKGNINLIVRALVGNQWTEATVVPIVID